MNDSLPTLLRDLANTLDTDLMMDPGATAEVAGSPVSQPVGPDRRAGRDLGNHESHEGHESRNIPVTPDRRAGRDLGNHESHEGHESRNVPVVPDRRAGRDLENHESHEGHEKRDVAANASPEPGPAAPGGDGVAALAAIAEAIAACTTCSLSATRHNTVPGVGKLSPDVMFIGEGPGADEDAQGLPFVGRAGALLTKMIAAMGYTREEVFIANIVKCRPPENRKPTPQEMGACIPFLERQVEIVRPKYIVALGATAVQGLLNTTAGINSLRGHWAEYRGIPVMPTFHPAYLLRSPSSKREAWSDLKQVMARLGRLPATGNG